MTHMDILHHLDELMDFNSGNLYPALNNAHYDLADTRMSVFRSDREWVIFFEQVYYNKPYVGCFVSLWAYGNCLSEEGWLEPYSWWPFEPPGPLASSTLDLKIPVSLQQGFSILLKGERMVFKPTIEQYAAAGVTLSQEEVASDDLSMKHMLRFLCHHLDHPFFASEDYLRYMMAIYRIDPHIRMWHRLKLLLQTRDWRHPDLNGVDTELLPSDVECFRILARAIETGDLTEWRQQDPATFNTQWKFWEEV